MILKNAVISLPNDQSVIRVSGRDELENVRLIMPDGRVERAEALPVEKEETKDG